MEAPTRGLLIRSIDGLTWTQFRAQSLFRAQSRRLWSRADNSEHNPVVIEPVQSIQRVIPLSLILGRQFRAQSGRQWSRADYSSRNPVVTDPEQNIPRVIPSPLSLLKAPTWTIANCTPHDWLDTWQSAKSLNGPTSPNHKNSYETRTFKGKFRWNKRFRLCLPQQKQNKKWDISVLMSGETTSDKMTIKN